MIRKNLMKELEADIRNKITFPKVILGCFMSDDKNIKTSQVEKAINSLDQIPHLIEEWFTITDEEYEVIKALVEGELNHINELQEDNRIIKKYKDTLASINRKLKVK